MAIVKKNVTNFAGFTGTPASDTNWDELKWDFAARGIMIVVEAGSTADLEISMNGKDSFGKLPAPEANMNSLIYYFKGVDWSRLFVRKTGATINVYAYAPK